MCIRDRRTADAGLLVDDRDLLGFFFGVERFDFAPEQVGEFAHAFLTAGRAQVDFGFAFGDGFGVGLAARVAALAALRLRQDGLDFFDQRIALSLIHI